MLKRHFLIPLVAFCSLAASTVQAQSCFDENLKPFYAISSLRYYLEQDEVKRTSNYPQAHDQIHLAEVDIQRLWSAASSAPLSPIIAQAHDYYLQSLNAADDQKKHLALARSRMLLKNAWKQLNLYTAKKPKKTSKQKQKQVVYPFFDDHPFLTQDAKQAMRPHLLPLYHPLKLQLDGIFAPNRVIQNEESFQAAQFNILFKQANSLIWVAQHPLLPDHLVKLYLDDHDPQKKRKPTSQSGWQRLVNRCKGAKNVRSLINKRQLKHFVVPDKWLYPTSYQNLPEDQIKNSQPVVLVVSRMDIYNSHECHDLWKTVATPEILDELFCILSHGFASAYLPFNVPYCRDGKFACIDTEYPERMVDYAFAKRYLSDEMALYWDELIKNGGK